jgi:hypothetical protein
MAGVYAVQGHTHKAQEILRSILKIDPANAAARQELEALAGRMQR